MGVMLALPQDCRKASVRCPYPRTFLLTPPCAELAPGLKGAEFKPRPDWTAPLFTPVCSARRKAAEMETAESVAATAFPRASRNFDTVPVSQSLELSPGHNDERALLIAPVEV